eukprot:TRINITY_DN16412_c0_g1_i4.p1 TRINITY_DN16412_c0_g1~~TRINITY_DN16412_c0_g1_i4.p1  ORF type:complete len:531 (-),score=66.22 TRINITY_DN16412_c0_g1_i4:20-1537(-)
MDAPLMPKDKDALDITSSSSSSSLQRRRGRRLLFVLGLVAVCVVALSVGLIVMYTQLRNSRPIVLERPQNVILLISDGFGPASVTLGREYLGRSLTFDPYLIGGVRTYSYNSLVTDSAAGATAYACGVKTYNTAVGVDANQKPCGTILQAARDKGMKTGVVVTKSITDATPASFLAHAAARSDDAFIATQIATSGADILFGGGLQYFSNSTRQDGQDLVGQMKQAGYTFASSPDDLSSLKTLPAAGFFSPNHFPYVIDRLANNSAPVPSLRSMVEKALALLSEATIGKDKGFFLLIEGSLIDMAAHNNDAAAHVHEIEEFDDVWQYVLSFAKEDGRTAVLSTSDHETGGLVLAYQPNPLASPPYVYFPGRLNTISASADVMATMVTGGGGGSRDVVSILNSYANVTDLSSAELDQIHAANATGSHMVLSSTIGKIVSTRAWLSWSTFGHSGTDVPLYGYNLPLSLSGVIQNTRIATYIAEILKLDLDAATEKVKDFVPYPPDKVL